MNEKRGRSRGRCLSRPPSPQLASAPEGSVILSLSLGGVGKFISAPRPEVTAAERQVQLAHSSVLTRAHEPPSKPAKRWSAGREKNLVVNFARFARPIVMNDVLQSQPAIPRIAHAGLEFHVYLVSAR
jgi:hypothetical protein